MSSFSILGTRDNLSAQVPSGFLLTDIWLRLDEKFRGGLVKPAPPDSKVTHAAKEAKRLKKLMGSLRYLYRNGFLDATASLTMYQWQSTNFFQNLQARAMCT